VGDEELKAFIFEVYGYKGARYEGIRVKGYKGRV